MNKLSFFALLLSLTSQISLAESVEDNPYKSYEYLPTLENELSKNCSTVKPASMFQMRSNRECACDELDKYLYWKACIYGAHRYEDGYISKNRIIDNMREVLGDESDATKIENYDKYLETAKKLDETKWLEYEKQKAESKKQRKESKKELRKKRLLQQP